MTFAQCQGCASPACIVNGECCFPKGATIPIAWGLLNPVTGALGRWTYNNEAEAKRIAHVSLTDPYHTIIAVPLFLGGEGTRNVAESPTIEETPHAL